MCVTVEETRSAKTNAVGWVRVTTSHMSSVVKLTPDIVVRGPKVDVDGVKDTEERESPRDTLNNGMVTGLGELVDDGAEE